MKKIITTTVILLSILFVYSQEEYDTYNMSSFQNKEYPIKYTEKIGFLMKFIYMDNL